MTSSSGAGRTPMRRHHQAAYREAFGSCSNRLSPASVPKSPSLWFLIVLLAIHPRVR